jgi:creatinine amidohydrolase/Fe(II)-dependent formamide hydrolase-like protein
VHGEIEHGGNNFTLGEIAGRAEQNYGARIANAAVTWIG